MFYQKPFILLQKPGQEVPLGQTEKVAFISPTQPMTPKPWEQAVFVPDQRTVMLTHQVSEYPVSRVFLLCIPLYPQCLVTKLGCLTLRKGETGLSKGVWDSAMKRELKEAIPESRLRTVGLSQELR